MLPLQYLIELGVLLEIAWNVLRPVHASLPRGTVKAFIALTVLAVVGGTLLASHVHPTGNKVYDIKAPMDLTVGLLRISIFVVTVGFAHVLGIGWKDRVLQLATALSFYSAADLIVSLGERHNGGPNTLEPLAGLPTSLSSVFWSGHLQLKMYGGVNSVHKWNSFWLHLQGEPSLHGRRWFGCR